MQKRQVLKVGFLLLCSAGLLSACASLQAPKGWLPMAPEVQSQAYGCWIVVDHLKGDQLMITSGELIAVTPDSMFILNESGLSEISAAAVKKTKLEIFKERKVVGLWAMLGTLSTLSHGFYLVLSAPIWVISGISGAVGESRSGIVEIEGSSPEEFRKYARFPQGLPAGIDLRSLKAKTALKKPDSPD